jgi:hypothetical protein
MERAMPDGFRNILDDWRRAGESANADHVELALATFQRQFPQAYDNLAVDKQVLPSHREELMNQLQLVDPDRSETVEGKIIGFCRSHQGCGSRNATAERAHLGHAEERTKTERTLASTATGRSPLTRRKRSVGLMVDDLLRRDLAGQQALLACRLSSWLMWAFYQPRSLGDPFRGVSKERGELVRRLGMGRTDPHQELLVWAHRLLPHQRAHKPTAFDAEAYEYFRPGGKTQPLTGTDGLHEVVHGPIDGGQLVARIEQAT